MLLTARQRDVLRLRASGLTNRQVADHLGLSAHTVKHHQLVAHRALEGALAMAPTGRGRSYLVCYALGLLDAGLPATEVMNRVRAASTEAATIRPPAA